MSVKPIARAAALTLRVLLGGLLLAAGALKLRAPASFATEIANYQLVPALAPYLAATLPAIELVVGIALVGLPRRWRRSAALVALGLFAAFLVAVTSAFLRHVNIACGCFGAGGGPISALTVARNSCLVLAAAALLALEGPRPVASTASPAHGD
jgi:uncharacterized membrane protein YphA (DoxX/SURF4 family)